MTAPLRVAIYTRVSTDDQTTANQLAALRDVAARRGWEIAAEYTDEGISGSRGRAGRPGFDRLWRAVSRREIDLVMAWSVDRLGRSLADLIAFLGECGGTGVDLYLHQQGLDTSTPAGRAMFQMLGVFAEFERGMIRDRIRAGLARRRAQGLRVGRPRPAAGVVRRAQELRDGGMGVNRVAARVGLAVGTVLKYTRAAAHEEIA